MIKLNYDYHSDSYFSDCGYRVTQESGNSFGDNWVLRNSEGLYVGDSYYLGELANDHNLELDEVWSNTKLLSPNE